MNGIYHVTQLIAMLGLDTWIVVAPNEATALGLVERHRPLRKGDCKREIVELGRAHPHTPVRVVTFTSAFQE